MWRDRERVTYAMREKVSVSVYVKERQSEKEIEN